MKSRARLSVLLLVLLPLLPPLLPEVDAAVSLPSLSLPVSSASLASRPLGALLAACRRPACCCFAPSPSSSCSCLFSFIHSSRLLMLPPTLLLLPPPLLLPVLTAPAMTPASADPGNSPSKRCSSFTTLCMCSAFEGWPSSSTCGSARASCWPVA